MSSNKNYYYFSFQPLSRAVQPIREMAVDFIDILKPYPSRKSVKRDLFQPFLGLENIGIGAANIIAAPFMLLINTVKYAFRASSVSDFIKKTATNIYKVTCQFLHGLCNIFRGITRIIYAPLTWLLKMPLRGIITAYNSTPTATKKTLHSGEHKKTEIRRRWKNTINRVLNRIRHIPTLDIHDPLYQLERSDPKHRYALSLIKEFHVWKESTTKKEFFSWLDQQEKKTGPYIPRMEYRTTKQEQQQNLIHFACHTLYTEKNNICDTSQFKGKYSGYGCFVLSTENKLYLQDQFHQQSCHASLLGGDIVACAGLMKVQQGKIKKIINYSGHYQPGLEHLLYAVKNIPENCFAKDAEITYQKTRFPNACRWLKESKYTFFRTIGRAIGQMKQETKFKRAEFILFAEKEFPNVPAINNTMKALNKIRSLDGAKRNPGYTTPDFANAPSGPHNGATKTSFNFFASDPLASHNLTQGLQSTHLDLSNSLTG